MAVPNGLNPDFDRVTIRGKGKIYAGAATTSATIEAEYPCTTGSIYLSTNGSGEIWVCQQADLGNEWTKLTIN